jgi:hypothetical protein
VKQEAQQPKSQMNPEENQENVGKKPLIDYKSAG